MSNKPADVNCGYTQVYIPVSLESASNFFYGERKGGGGEWSVGYSYHSEMICLRWIPSTRGDYL